MDKLKIKFDYLHGPVLGHKTRCEILKQAFIDRGHEIVDGITGDGAIKTIEIIEKWSNG